MRKLINHGTWSQIIDEEDSDLLSKLDEALSFKVPGAEFSRAFKGYVDRTGKFTRWDGLRHVLTKDLKVGSGLIPRIVEFYKDNGLEIEVEDNRPVKSIGSPIDILPRLKEMGKIPYKYQSNIIPTIDKNDRGIIKLSTGGGKSILSALITAHLGKKAIIYVIGKDLLYQFYDLFRDIFGDRAGIVGDGVCQISDFNIVSIWTAGQAIGIKKGDLLLEADDSGEKVDLSRRDDIIKMMEESRVNFWDECHMSACGTIQEIYRHSKNAEHQYGLSGTPWREDNADLLIEAILGRYIVNIPASYLIERGFLAKPIIKFIEVPELTIKPINNVYATLYKDYIVNNSVRNNLILKSTKMLVDQGYQTLVLFNSLAHGKILYELISQDVECVVLDGSDNKETRDEVKRKVMAGEVRCVLASRIFDIGIDLPCLSGLVLAGGGKSSVKALQRVGRVIRKYDGKTHAAVVDFADTCKFLDKHSKIRFKVYRSEDGFDVSWVKKKIKK